MVYAVLTFVFVVCFIGAVATVLGFIGLTAYDYAPIGDDRPSSPGVLEAHPDVLHAAIGLTVAAVALALVLSILDRFRE